MDRPQIVQVDERDSSWEDPNPRFRVYFHGSGADSTSGWTDTYDLTGVDVAQVIDWAQKQATDGVTYAIALVRERDLFGGDRGLVWLLGVDGNDVPMDGHDVEGSQRRMLARRARPIGIPAADQMPPGVANRQD